MKIVINVTLFHFLCLCIKHTSKLFFNNRLLWLAGCTSEWNSWFKFVLYLNGCALSFLFWGWTTSHSHHPLRLTELLCTERIMSGCCGNGYLVGDCWTDSFVYAQIHVLLFSLAVFHHSFLFFKYQTHHGYDFPLWNVKAKKWTHIWEALCKKKKKKKIVGVVSYNRLTQVLQRDFNGYSNCRFVCFECLVFLDHIDFCCHLYRPCISKCT